MGVCGYALRVTVEEVLKDMRTLHALSSSQIVERVAAHGSLFKKAGEVFQGRAPDDAAGMALVQAYQDGVAPAWMTAYLLA